jgi:hypothetical protein
MKAFPFALAVAVVVVLAAGLADSRGQQRVAEPDPFVLLVEGIRRVELGSKKPIRAVRVDNEQTARLERPVKDGRARLVGVATGTTRMTITDADGNQITRPVTVRSNQLIIGVGELVRLQMTSRRPIKEIFNQRPTVVHVTVMAADATTLLIKGLAAGTSRITLTDDDGNTEVRGR